MFLLYVVDWAVPEIDLEFVASVNTTAREIYHKYIWSIVLSCNFLWMQFKVVVIICNAYAA